MTDKILEAAIDDAGRADVFAIVRAAGWTSDSAPPKWVWWEAIRTVRALRSMQDAPNAPEGHDTTPGTQRPFSGA